MSAAGMKWRNLTPKMLRGIAGNLHEAAHDHNVERDLMAEERGFDVVGVEECVARFLNREAKRRETRTGPPPLDGETFDAVFHRIQDGYPDGWPRAVFVDSEGEPVGVKCGPHEAAAIEAGAHALVEVAALRGEVERLRAIEAQSKATTAAINARLRSGDCS